MKKPYYFDTSIWLDFLENRNESNLPKGDWARELISKIIKKDGKIILSDNNLLELSFVGYSNYEIENLLTALRSSIDYVQASRKQIGKAKDLSQKRGIPKRDALHSLIARDNSAILVTLDNHFKKLADIAKPHNPKNLT